MSLVGEDTHRKVIEKNLSENRWRRLRVVPGIVPLYLDLLGEKSLQATSQFLLNFCKHLAGEEGFEPSQTDPESVVLPLDDSPAPLLFYREVLAPSSRLPVVSSQH